MSNTLLVIEDEPDLVRGLRDALGFDPRADFDEDDSVDGVVYRDLPISAWSRLDRFEGDMYRRQRVEVELNDGTLLNAETYIVRLEYLDHLEESGWDLGEFLRKGKDRFQESYRGYQQL